MRVRSVNGLFSLIPNGNVDTGQWRRSEGGVLLTVAAFTCVAVAVHLPDEAVGYLGHFSALDPQLDLYDYVPMTDTAEFDAMIDDIKTRRPSRIEAWLGGGAVKLNDRYASDGLRQRAYAESQISQLEPDSLVVDWEDKARATDVLLDCRSGDVLVQKIDSYWEDD
jgi:hypothetical protein